MSSNFTRNMATATAASRDADEERSNQNYVLSSTLIGLTNMFVFSSGLLLFILGLQYLTTYRYEFSFTVYSIDMVAGFFIALGVLTLALSLLFLLALKPFGSPQVATSGAAWTFFVFLVLFITGVVGLSLNATGQFNAEIRNNMYQTARQFDEMAMRRLETRRFNWVQRRFECCGLDNYADWRTVLMYGGGGGYRPGEAVNYNRGYQNRPYPYSESVPDSCCLQPMPGCGKNINGMGDMRDRTFLINTKGCFAPYSRQFGRDVTFVAGIAVGLGCLFLVITIILVSLAGLIRTNVKLLENNIEKQERKRFLK